MESLKVMCCVTISASRCRRVHSPSILLSFLSVRKLTYLRMSSCSNSRTSDDLKPLHTNKQTNKQTNKHNAFLNHQTVELQLYVLSGKEAVVESLSMHAFIHPFIHPSIHPSIHPFINLSIHPSIDSSIHLCIASIHASTYPFTHRINPSICSAYCTSRIGPTAGRHRSHGAPLAPDHRPYSSHPLLLLLLLLLMMMMLL